MTCQTRDVAALFAGWTVPPGRRAFGPRLLAATTRRAVGARARLFEAGGAIQALNALFSLAVSRYNCAIISDKKGDGEFGQFPAIMERTPPEARVKGE